MFLKLFLSEVVLPTAFLISRMPTKIFGSQNPVALLSPQSSAFSLPPGCLVVFVMCTSINPLTPNLIPRFSNASSFGILPLPKATSVTIFHLVPDLFPKMSPSLSLCLSLLLISILFRGRMKVKVKKLLMPFHFLVICLLLLFLLILGKIKRWMMLTLWILLILLNLVQRRHLILYTHEGQRRPSKSPLWIHILSFITPNQITLEYDVKQLATATKSTAAIYMACGVDTTKASVFVQSHVRAHVELMWLLSSVTPIGRVNRMIQFKEKSRKAGDEQVGVALLTYPVLMASDILLYQSDLVPVGEDQKQHLELTRELAERVNYMYGRKWKKMGGRSSAIFKVPESLIPPAGARVMSLTDGLSKMSKSDPSDQSRINLLDPKDVIANKIKRCKTDSFPGLEFGNPERPECNNLLSIYQLISGRTKEVRYEEIMSDSAYLDRVLAEGATKAAVVADATLNNVYQAMGFLRR
ncbi:tryptophan--tRNA ligase, chloroplastic/mitochondrial-like isoform X2 [Macadamia integrifolia]|uniref:tryptophan--tRNA ligase, chloroplastic/mitochondrial-like isoform X2 n=1 Tax=Macadamia integrifolia TaxID=60698 RepID=UPI001C4E72A6|nr:tryptophan--tRNA ligase, chloroplastic/mitochondrial-like isoform X2 [Macadamia integrifolia]